MDYEQKYKDALERAKNIYGASENEDILHTLETLFPELKGNEYESTRKRIIALVNAHGQGRFKESMLAWLEKQGRIESDPRYENLEELLAADDIYQMSMNDEMVREAKEKAVDALSGMCIGRLLGLEKQGKQKPADKSEPKFHEGDWVVCEAGELTSTLQITNIKKGCYWFHDDSYLPVVDEDCLHLWTIKDAKDGDVLYCKSDCGVEFIVMSKGVNNRNNIDSYFRYNSDDGFGIDIPNVFSAKQDNITPATKEQRDLLFQKMNEAGYEWDAEKKELKKIEQSKLTEFEDAVKDMMDDYRDAIDANDATTEEVKERAAYMLSLIPHKPADWSEEDESNLNGILDCYKSMDIKWKNWLKSIKNRITWKPSDEQMQVLKEACDKRWEPDGLDPLYTLYKDLEKLKGE